MQKIILLAICLMANMIALPLAANAKEIKLGVMQHDFDTKLGHRYEKGQNINVEFLFDKMQNYLRAHPHIGASINSAGYTSNIYTGLSWQFEIVETIFVEASLGISLNNAERLNSKKRRALGSQLLFRESFSLGALINAKNIVAITIDHISSADIRKPNPGLTDIGIRYGYRF